MKKCLLISRKKDDLMKHFDDMIKKVTDLKKKWNTHDSFCDPYELEIGAGY